MTRFLIYLFPAVADVVIASALFVCSNRLADAGKSKTEVAAVFTAWAVVYIITNQILGRFVTSRNAARMLITANLLFAATAGAFVLFPQILAIYGVMAVLAVATALFFLPFQLFMKAVEPDQHQGVVRSTALYTFSWSLGFACGPFVAGFIYQWMGWQWCFAFNALLSVLIAGGIFLLKHHARHHHDEAASPEQLPAGETDRNNASVNYHDFPDLAWLGWVGAGVGCMGIYVIIALLPSLGVAFKMPKSEVGLIIATLYVVQALMGLFFLRSRTWMFRARPVVGFAVFGLVSMAVFCVSLLPAIDGIHFFAISLRTLCMYAAAVCYGVFSGAFFFCLVFHSLVHPERSAKYIAVNETVVGICCAAGPLMAGMLAD
ncbi:MAG: MFS transporter, partial [Phycisphaerae bacterium]|nr:MFS transporter [Phycisphaerae bacterium]